MRFLECVGMAGAEHVLVDRKTIREIVEFMENAVKEGLTKEEIMSQIDLMLDKDAQKRIRRSEKDIRAGRVKHFKTAKDLLADLHSSD